MQLIRRPAAYDPARGPLEAFLFGVMRNMVRKQSGKLRHHLAMEECDDDEAFSETPLLEGLARDEPIAAVRGAIAALPEHYREAVVLL